MLKHPIEESAEYERVRSTQANTGGIETETHWEIG